MRIRRLVVNFGLGVAVAACGANGGETSSGSDAADGSVDAVDGNDAADGIAADGNDGADQPDAADGNDGADATDGSTGADSADSGAVIPEPIEPGALTEEEKQFQTEFAALLDAAATTDYAGLVEAHPTPVYETELGYDPNTAASMDALRLNLGMTAASDALLAKNGFVVVPVKDQTPSRVYDRLYKDHLPLLITADSVLHALHQSFDDILKALELATLRGEVTALLADTHAALVAPAGEPATMAAARGDVDVYLTVARSLMAGSAVAPNDPANLADVNTLLGQVEKLQLEEMRLFGVERKEDFSQFEPRGHYTETEELKQYFRSMMWVGRIDFRFREFDADTGEVIWNDRQIRAAWLLRQALNAGGARPAWELADRLIGALMGEIDSMDFRSFDAFAESAALDSADKVAGDLSAAHGALEGGRYGTQRISSHYLKTNPFSSDVTPLPIAFTALGQRYIIDSHVMSNAVYDRIVAPGGGKPFRALPSPFDPMFVLGNNAALPHLETELNAWQYAGNLQAMRFLADAHDETFWDNSVYNLWLSSLRALNTVPDATGIPAAMKTAAWADKTLHTQLASWAELRHDTILYAKQSYTGGVSCEYPDAYVEPYPALWGRLGRAAERIATVVASAPGDENLIANVGSWAERWVSAMALLESMATKELTDDPFDTAELKLVSDWIAEESQGCTTSYTGIYPKLIYDAEDITEADPTIADIHTNPSSDGPLAPPRVLHVGTGLIDVVVLTRMSCEGVKAYAGPVTSFYEVIEPGLERLTDEEWSQRLWSADAPAQPAWVKTFISATP